MRGEPLLDLLSCWLFVVLLIAFPKPHEPPIHSGEAQTDSTFHLSLSKHRMMTLVAALPQPVLSWISPFLLLSLPDFSLPWLPEWFFSYLYSAIFHLSQTFSKCKHTNLSFCSGSQEINLDPMFLGMYPYESSANFQRKWSDSSNIAIYPISALYDTRSKRQIFIVQRSFHSVLLL